MKLNCYLIIYSKSISKWIIDPNVTAKIIKFLENIRKNHSDVGLGKEFLNKTQSTKYEKYIKLTSSKF